MTQCDSSAKQGEVAADRDLDKAKDRELIHTDIPGVGVCNR